MRSYLLRDLSSEKVAAAVIISDNPSMFLLNYSSYPFIVVSPEEAPTVIYFAKASSKPNASIEFQQIILGTKAAPAVISYILKGPSPSYLGVLKSDIITLY